MVSNVIVAAQEGADKLYTYYRKQGDYSHKASPMMDRDYEKDILLVVDEDDDTMFDYEENRLPNLLTNDDIMKMRM